jgi:hypothetical protein
MATYPTGTYSPAPVSANQTITSARENAQDAEITAIQDGLRNGLQHAVTVSTGGLTVSTGSFIAGGPSSLATLQVNGASTFVGPVTFSTVVTFSTTPTLTFPCVRLTHTADQAVGNASFTGLSWNTEDDNAGMHSTSANSSRITFAHSTGVYAVGASVEWNPSTSGYRVIRIMVNDVTGVVANLTPVSSVSALQMPMAVSGLVRAGSTTDYVTVQVFQNTGSTNSITNSTAYGTVFWCHKVSA